MRGLGGCLLDASGSGFPLGGKALLDLAWVELAGLDPRIRDAEIVVASDVDNPLLGADGRMAMRIIV